MTAKERAITIVAEHLGASGYIDEDASSAEWLRETMRQGIEQAIITAIEKERQISISAIQSQMEWAMQNRDKSVSDSADWHFWFGEVKACELLIAQIRARSNPDLS